MKALTAQLLFLFTFFAIPLPGAEAGATAMLVLEHDEAVLDAALRPAITDAAPLTRATAARVANVRNRTKLLDDLRAQLDREKDLTAAREEMRAVVMLGGGAEIDRALAVSDRFGKQLDGAVSVAVARLGPEVAVPAYFDKLHARAGTVEFFRIIPWGHPEMRSLLASRLVGTSDDRGFRSLLSTLDAKHSVDGGVLAAALRGSTDLRAAASEYVLSTQSSIDERVRATLPDLPPATGNELLVVDELLRRAAGIPHQQIALTAALRDEAAAGIVRGMPEGVLALLTPEERKMIAEPQLPVVKPAGDAKPLPPRDFVLPTQLPAGLDAALLKESRCSAAWIGVVDVDVDPAGRVTAISSRDFDPPSTCRRAAEALLRLSLASRPRVGAPRRSEVLMLHARKPDLCLDEELEEFDPADVWRAGAVTVQGVVKAPVAVHKVNPFFPRDAGPGLVVIEGRISKSGCMSGEQLLKQTEFPSLNAAALLAVDEWTFKPGTLNGRPVDVIFNVAIQFKR